MAVAGRILPDVPCESLCPASEAPSMKRILSGDLLLGSDVTMQSLTPSPLRSIGVYDAAIQMRFNGRANNSP